MRISDWSSDVCSSDLAAGRLATAVGVCRQICDAVGTAGRPGDSACELELSCAVVAVRLPGPGGAEPGRHPLYIGRARCRERVCPYVSISVVAVSLKKKSRYYERV